MSKFQKIKNFGSAATVVSYAYFQAFKFPDSMNVHFQCVIQVCRYNCPDPVCPEDAVPSSGQIASQATITVAPVFGSSGSVSDLGSAPDSYVVNPRNPSVLPATRRNFNRGKIGPGRFSARRGRDELADYEIFDYSDMDSGASHQLNLLKNGMNNQYYQSYVNHRVKRHEEEMKKTNLGEVKTNSSVQVLKRIFSSLVLISITNN